MDSNISAPRGGRSLKNGYHYTRVLQDDSHREIDSPHGIAWPELHKEKHSSSVIFIVILIFWLVFLSVIHIGNLKTSIKLIGQKRKHLWWNEIMLILKISSVFYLYLFIILFTWSADVACSGALSSRTRSKRGNRREMPCS